MRDKICSVCGKPSRGKVCMECIKANKKHKYTACIDCGGPILPSYKPRRCRPCAYKAIKARNKARQTHPDIVKCAQCGKEFPWQYRFQFTDRYYCSLRCSALSRSKTQKHGTEYEKEALLLKLTSYIKEKGRYVTREELHEQFHVTDKVYTRLKISIVDLNNSLGYYYNKPPVKDNMEELKRLIATGKYHNVTKIKEIMGGRYPKRARVKRLFEEAGIYWSYGKNRKKLKKDMIAYIKQIGRYVPITALMRKFHFDFYCTWLKGGYNLEELHNEAGVAFVHTYSYYESLSYTKLVEAFGSEAIVRQQSFPDLKSEKRWRLRYDFCMPAIKVLIEVDGTQHRPESTLFRPTTASNDAKKDKYAKDNGYRLYRLDTTPAATFESRLCTMIEEIRTLVKESELLES